MAKAIPDGYRTVTPYLTVKGAAQAIEFYKRAFGARESERMTGPDGKSVMHAEIQIGDSLVMLSDEFPQMGSRSPQTLGGTTAAIFLYVPDVDAAFQQAVDAGAKAIMPPADMFWGDRFGKLVDPFGHEWAMATHKEDLAPEEIRKRGAAAMASMCSDAGHPS
jgi:PhnB protein